MPPGGTAGSAIAPLLLPFIRLEQVLGRGVGVEDVGFHARGAAGGALYLVLLGVHDLESDLVLGEHAPAHAAHQPGLAHAALLPLALLRSCSAAYTNIPRSPPD